MAIVNQLTASFRAGVDNARSWISSVAPQFFGPASERVTDVQGSLQLPRTQPLTPEGILGIKKTPPVSPKAKVEQLLITPKVSQSTILPEFKTPAPKTPAQWIARIPGELLAMAPELAASSFIEGPVGAVVAGANKTKRLNGLVKAYRVANNPVKKLIQTEIQRELTRAPSLFEQTLGTIFSLSAGSLAYDGVRRLEGHKVDKEDVLLSVALGAGTGAVVGGARGLLAMNQARKIGVTIEKLESEANRAKRTLATTGRESPEILSGSVKTDTINKLGKEISIGDAVTPKTIGELRTTIEPIKNAIKTSPKALEELSNAQRVSRVAADLIRRGELNVNEDKVLKKLAEKYGLDNHEFAKQLEEFATLSGKGLNIYSQYAKRLGSLLAKRGIKDIERPIGTWEKINNNFRKGNNIWRASITSQLATAMRNTETFGARYFMNIVDDAMQGAYLVATGKESARTAFGPFVEDLLAISRQLTKKDRNKLMTLLDAEPIRKDKLFSNVAGDLTLGSKITNTLSTFNRIQSYATRTLTMSAEIGTWARKSGINFEDIKPSDIPDGVWNKAINKALGFDFSANPTNAVAKDFIRIFNKYPVLQAVVYPFPRYLSNAVRHIWEFSPLGFSKFFDPKVAKQLQAGNREAISVANKAIIGTSMFASAYHIRNSEYAGEKWYEVRVGDKTLDVRPFGPILPTYLFIAEAIKSGPERFTPRDWLEGMTGINRIAGTTLFMTSVLSGNSDWGSFKKATTGFIGQYIGGFGVPARTLRDFMGQIIDEEAVVRYTKENPLIGPFQSSIPVWDTKLPPYPAITREDSYMRQDPAIRQLTGVSLYEKNYLEIEMDRLGIDKYYLIPKTGDAWINREITLRTGILMQDINDLMGKSKNYQSWNDEKKTAFVKEAFSAAKKEAKQHFLKTSANEIAEHYLDTLATMDNKEKRNYLGKLKGKGILPEEVADIILERLF
jgi:hypothetical protein